MRRINEIFDAWENAEVFAGDAKPNGVITVEPDWYLNLTAKEVGSSKHGPFRWFQRADDSQTMLVVPNVKTIQIDRSIDQDVASMTFSITNQQIQDKEDAQITPGQFGQPGFYTFDYGESADAQARWGQTTNSWNGILNPNALFRTYQGFGGGDITTTAELDVAIAAGNLVITGCWLADTVDVSSSGDLTIKCRDMGKLLIEQKLIPPLVPLSEYPLEYRRWEDEDFPTELSPGGTGADGGEVFLTYKDSSGDRWSGSNDAIHGHRPTDSLDGKSDTWAMSVGNGSPSALFCTDFFEYEPSGQISSVYIHPWLGNYDMYISVLENGVWQGDPNALIVYDHTPLLSSQPGAANPDTGADKPYVGRFSVPWETGRWYDLPRTYDAQRLRITFRNHQKAQWGPFYYRCGIREIRAAGGDPIGGVSVPQAMAIETYELGGGFGYRIVDHAGSVTPFGEATSLPQNIDQENRGVSTYSVDMAHLPSGAGDGYWVLDSNGHVRPYGDAAHYSGSTLIDDETYLGEEDNFGVIAEGPPREVIANQSGVRADVTDAGFYYRVIVPTYTGLGYWLLAQNVNANDTSSQVEAHGDAELFYDNATHPFWNITGGYEGVADAASNPVSYGFWAISEYGFVYSYGTCLWYGNPTLQAGEKIVTIKPTSTGLGYYTLGSYGSFESFGDASSTFDGAILPFSSATITAAQETEEGFLEEYVDFAFNSDSSGGYLMRRSGEIIPFGDAIFFGSALGLGFKRTPGNMTDYSDVVKDMLLYSGWYLFENSPQEAGVFGGIESSGVHPGESAIGSEFFDKKPVIDVINALKEIVGFIFFIDVDGGAVFRSPNWWAIGNFNELGERIAFMPEIDEATTLLDYSVNTSDEDARSEIIISDTVPEDGNFTTRVTRVVPPTANLLRGMVKPAIWTNENFIDPDEQKIMAELISLHIWFQRRIGSVTAIGNPCLMPDDQVRIFERTTGESYVHYIRAIATNMNLESGEYQMNLTTHWLGSDTQWVITRDGLLDENGYYIDISEELIDRIRDYASSNNYDILGNGNFTISSNVEVVDETGGGPGG